MIGHTPLDQAISIVETDTSDAASRALYDRLSATELYVLLETEAQGDHVTPRVIDTPKGQAVLAFDDAARLAKFVGQVVPSLCLPGKDLCELLAPTGVGIALNFDVSENPYLLPPETVAWIAETLSESAKETHARPSALRYPKDLPKSFLRALEQRLEDFPGAADRAVLCVAAYIDGSVRLLVAFLDAQPERQELLTETVRDAVALTLPEHEVDIGFFSNSDRIGRALIRNGLSFELPKRQKLNRTAPGMDPEKPPIL